MFDNENVLSGFNFSTKIDDVGPLQCVQYCTVLYVLLHCLMLSSEHDKENMAQLNCVHQNITRVVKLLV